jgi:hypothetical protein
MTAGLPGCRDVFRAEGTEPTHWQFSIIVAAYRESGGQLLLCVRRAAKDVAIHETWYGA